MISCGRLILWLCFKVKVKSIKIAMSDNAWAYAKVGLIRKKNKNKKNNDRDRESFQNRIASSFNASESFNTYNFGAHKHTCKKKKITKHSSLIKCISRVFIFSFELLCVCVRVCIGRQFNLKTSEMVVVSHSSPKIRIKSIKTKKNSLLLFFEFYSIANISIYFANSLTLKRKKRVWSE